MYLSVGSNTDTTGLAPWSVHEWYHCMEMIISNKGHVGVSEDTETSCLKHMLFIWQIK